MSENDAVLVPVNAMRFDVTGWSITDPNILKVQGTLGGRRWPWVELRHMDHPTGQEVRVVEVEDGFRVRFRNRDLAVTVTVLPAPEGEEEGHLVGWHVLEEAADVERLGLEFADRPRLPAVIYQCSGCGEEARNGGDLADGLLAVVYGWATQGARGKPRLNLLSGHRMKRTPEKVRERAERMGSPRARGSSMS